MIDATAFTARKLADALHIWNRSAITLVDIRHNLLSYGQTLANYRLPANAFLYARGDKAEVGLDDTLYPMERFGLFHTFKGSELTLTPQSKWLEYYMVLYKAGDSPLHKAELAKLLAATNPFRQQYGFLPSNPLFFAEQLRKMYEKWKGPTPLNLFYGKTAFYQLVYEVYEELEQGGIHVFEPDIVTIAARYLDKHYKDSIAIQQLCEALGISYSHFHRSFKQQMGESPQVYLIKNRLAAAMQALQEGDASIQEVAIHCGFPDEVNFYRQFVKHVGVAPSVYRQTSQCDMRDGAMETRLPFAYNWESQVSVDKLDEKGATFMFKQIRSKAMVATALSLMLFLSACSTLPATSNGVDPTPTAAVTRQATEPEGVEPMEEGTRMIHTVMGDVEVPMKPQRIVSYYLSGNIYAFDIEPIGLDSVGESFAGLVKEAQVVNFSNSEEVMALNPDLIVLSNDYFYEDMAKIAPTVLVPYEMSVEEQITFLGQVLNEEEKAIQILENYHNIIDRNKSAIAQAGLLDKTVTVVEGGFSGMRIHGPTYVGGPAILYATFGFKAPARVEEDILEPKKSGTGFALETLPQYVEDILVQFVWEGMDDMSTNAVWTSLPAVKNDHLIEIPFSMAHYPDVLSQIRQIEYLADALLALQ